MLKIEVVIADSQPVFVKGLKGLLETMDDIKVEVKAVFYDGQELMSYLSGSTPDLLIMDLNLNTLDGFEAIKCIRENRIKTQLVVLTAYDDERMVKKIRQLKVEGLLFKTEDTDIITKAIKKILTGQTYYSSREARPGRIKDIAGSTGAAFGDGFQKKFSLTKRERQIVGLITDALSSKEIAETLYISDQTVSVHRKNIMRKLGVNNTAALIKVAYRYGWK